MRNLALAAGALGLALGGCGGGAPPPGTAAPPELPVLPAAPGATAPAPSSAAAPPAAADPIAAALAAPDRSADDRALDEGRKPAEWLAFFGIAPGMRVAELGAGGGATTELLARIVGASGKVYAQNSRVILER